MIALWVGKMVKEPCMTDNAKVKEPLHSLDEAGECELKETMSTLKLLGTSTPLGSNTMAASEPWKA